MARIPVPAAGQVVARPSPGINLPAGAFDGGGAAIARVGEQVGNIATGMMDDQLREDQRQADIRARVQTVTARAGIEADHTELSAKYQAAILDGTMPGDQARKEFKREADAKRAERMKDLPKDLRAIVDAESMAGMTRFDLHLADADRKRTQKEIGAGLMQASEQYQRIAQGGPQARAKAENEFQTFATLVGPQAGLDAMQVQGMVQKFKEGTAFTEAFATAQAARNSVAELDKVSKRLAAGEWANADPQRLAVIQGQIDQWRGTLIQRAQIDADRREARAERAIASTQRQLAAGIPLTADAWAGLEKITRGTAVASEFGALVQSEKEIQTVLRAPLTDQLAYVRQKEADLAKGGTMEQAANVARIKRAVETNVATLQNAPLQFAATRTGQDVQPLDITALLTDPGKLAAPLQERAATVGALRKAYGEVVPLRVLTQDEAGALARGIAGMSASQQAAAYAQLKAATGNDPAVFRGIMQQIAPDSPVRALAGMIWDAQKSVTTKARWFTANDVARGSDVAATIIAGENIINPPKSQRGEDGKPGAANSLFMPDRETFDAEFVKQAGTGFENRPEALQSARQAAFAYYVGKASQTGRLNRDRKDTDTQLVRESVKATLGSPVERMGTTVFAPWGMDEAAFSPLARDAFGAAAASAGIHKAVDLWPRVGLRQVGGNSYMAVNGRQPLLGANGQPVIFKVGE